MDNECYLILDYEEYTTQYYNYSDFEGPGLEVDWEGITDYGLDRDGNGLYDFLVIKIPVNVTTADFYEFRVEFEEGYGEIDIQYFLDEGTEFVELFFEGPPFYYSEENGPYSIDYFRVYQGHVKIFQEEELYFTNSYRYQFFERDDEVAPEAFVQFTGRGNIEVIGYDVLDQNPSVRFLEKICLQLENNICNYELRNYEIEDEMGNKLLLKLKYVNIGGKKEIEILSLDYGNGEVDVEENKLTFWTTKENVYRNVFLENLILLSNYSIDDRETYFYIDDDGEIEEEVEDGFFEVGIQTHGGSLEYGID